MTPERTCVYVLVADAFCKIGRADNVSRRVAHLQTGCPFQITVAGVFDLTYRDALRVERAAHRRLAHVSVSGEWFRCTAERALLLVSGLAKSEASAEPPSPAPRKRRAEQAADDALSAWREQNQKMRDLGYAR